jgi:hypothetical protein
MVSTPHDPARQTVTDRLLDSLDQLVRRHRSLAPHSGVDAESHSALHVELIAAEVAHEVAMARSAWDRQPGSPERADPWQHRLSPRSF